MSYAEAITANDPVAILTAKKRIFQDSNPDNFHLVYQVVSQKPSVSFEEDKIAEILHEFTTTVLPDAHDMHGLTHRLNDIELDVDVISSVENSSLVHDTDIAFLKLQFPKKWRAQVERINELLVISAGKTDLKLIRVFPEKIHTVISVSTKSVDDKNVIEQLIPELGLVMDKREASVTDVDEVVIYALLAGPKVVDEVGQFRGVDFQVKVLA